MFTCRIENSKNKLLTLTQNETEYQIISIAGLNPPNAQINLSKVANLDGAKFNSSKLNERNLVITLKINGNVEKNRINLYSFFRSKELCKFYYQNGLRNVYIEGYCESVECDLFTNKELMQISLICPSPYFKSINEMLYDISKVASVFEFPFSINENEPIPISEISLERVTNIYNDSESETGIIIEINAIGNFNKLELRNVETGEQFIITYEFLKNDKVIINTNKGEKSVVLIRNATQINIFSGVNKTSTFFQLNIGDNFFSYLADDGASDDEVDITFKYRTIYGGV